MKEIKKQIATFNSTTIQRKIYTIRNQQVILDSDLALFYGVTTGRLNEQVKRNKERFPAEFMFQLTKEESDNMMSQFVISNEDSLRSQNAILKKGRGRHRKFLPYAFTEQGLAMLSAVLKSKTAVKMSIQIINAFVAMRKFLNTNAGVFQRLDNLEYKQIETDKKFEKVFDAMQNKGLEPNQGVFYNGQIFDAYKFISKLIRKADKSIILIDNYIDETILDLFTKKKTNVEITILTKKITKAMSLDIKKFNSQYSSMTIKKFTKAHDRFLIIDDKDVYHFGASLKDLGEKLFAFSKMDKFALSLLQDIKKV